MLDVVWSIRVKVIYKLIYVKIGFDPVLKRTGPIWMGNQYYPRFPQSLKITFRHPMANSSQFSPLNTLSDQLGPNSWVSSVFIIASNANIGKKILQIW